MSNRYLACCLCGGTTGTLKKSKAPGEYYHMRKSDCLKQELWNQRQERQKVEEAKIEKEMDEKHG